MSENEQREEAENYLSDIATKKPELDTFLFFLEDRWVTYPDDVKLHFLAEMRGRIEASPYPDEWEKVLANA